MSSEITLQETAQKEGRCHNPIGMEAEAEVTIVGSTEATNTGDHTEEIPTEDNRGDSTAEGKRAISRHFPKTPRAPTHSSSNNKARYRVNMEACQELGTRAEVLPNPCSPKCQETIPPNINSEYHNNHQGFTIMLVRPTRELEHQYQ